MNVHLFCRDQGGLNIEEPELCNNTWKMAVYARFCNVARRTDCGVSRLVYTQAGKKILSSGWDLELARMRKSKYQFVECARFGLADPGIPACSWIRCLPGQTVPLIQAPVLAVE
jgi:hypothetical protein